MVVSEASFVCLLNEQKFILLYVTDIRFYFAFIITDDKWDDIFFLSSEW